MEISSPTARDEIQFREAIAADAPDFLARLDGPSEVLELAQPYFPSHRSLIAP